MTPLEVCTALIGGMDAAEKAKVAALLNLPAAKPAAAPQLTFCQKNGHRFVVTQQGGLFSGPVLICTRCGRTRKSK